VVRADLAIKYGVILGFDWRCPVRRSPQAIDLADCYLPLKLGDEMVRRPEQKYELACA
jgi:hypothetical protein